MRTPDLGALISGWGSGHEVKVKDEGGVWREVTPDNLLAPTDGDEWVSLRDSIARYDKKHTKEES